jgi:hypothetical protein
VKHLLFLVLFFSLYACTAIDFTPLAPIITQPEALATPTAPALIPATPTMAAITPTPADTPTPPPAPDVERIRFAAGAVFAETNGMIQQGQQIDYALEAMQGQVMSVSLAEGYAYTLSVTAPNGQIISAPENGLPFWRGILPENGDYTLSVRADIPGLYTLRVVINPPGQDTIQLSHNDPEGLFALEYRDYFAPMAIVPPGDYRATPRFSLKLIEPSLLAPVTNLSEAYFLVNTADLGAQECTPTDYETSQGERTFNGQTYTASQSMGAAAGNLYDLRYFRTHKNGTCYEVVFYLHSGNIGNYDPALGVKEFDQQAILEMMEAILASLRLP